MNIGVLQFEVSIPDAASLKDKRRVVNSLKDRLHREHMVSIAEVGDPDVATLAVMALVCAARDGARAGDVLDKVCAKLRALPDGEVGPIHRQILSGIEHDFPPPLQPDDEPLTREVLDRARSEDIE